MLSCHSISSFLLEKHNLAQIVSKSVPPPSPELEELLCIKQEAVSLQISHELQRFQALLTPLVPGSRIWFPYYQHFTPASCGSSHLPGNCVEHSMCIQKQRARAAAGEQSQEVSWEGMWQGAGSLASTLIECFLQSGALCLLLSIQTKAILKKFSEGSEVHT